MALLRLGWDTDSWISRRTVRLAFESDEIVGRHTTCEINCTPAIRISNGAGRLLLPAWSLTRSPARNVTVTDVAGVQLPHLTRQQDREIAAIGLTAFTQQHYERLPAAADTPEPVFDGSFDETVKQILYRIDPTYGHPRPSGHAIWNLAVEDEFPELGVYIDDMRKTRVLFALPADTAAEHSPFLLAEYHVEALRARPSTGWMAWRMSRAGKPGGGRRSMYGSWRFFGAPLDDGLQSQAFDPTLVLADAAVMNIVQHDALDSDKGFRRNWRWAWWIPDSYVLKYPINDFLQCKSYHVELTTPDGVYIDKAHLRALNKGPSTNELIIVRDDDLHPDRAHLHFTRQLSRRGAADDEYVRCEIRFILRPTYHDGLRSAWHLSFWSCVTLWVLFATLGWSQSGRACAFDQCLLKVGDFDANSVVAVLVLAPSVALGLMARRDEHDMTKKIQGRLRFRLAILSLVLFFTALLLSLKPEGKETFWILLMSACIATFMTVKTGISALYSRTHVRQELSGDSSEPLL